jgi:hypothetical protein
MADDYGEGYEKSGGREVSDSEVTAVQEEITKHAKQLHEQGIINLDAPAREVIAVINEHFPGLESKRERAAQGQETVKAAASPYWLVGDRTWCNHLHD